MLFTSIQSKNIHNNATQTYSLEWKVERPLIQNLLGIDGFIQ